MFSTEPITAMNVPVRLVFCFFFFGFFPLPALANNAGQDMTALDECHVIDDKWKSEWNQPLQVVAREPRHAAAVVVRPVPPVVAHEPFHRPKGLLRPLTKNPAQRDLEGR